MCQVGRLTKDGIARTPFKPPAPGSPQLWLTSLVSDAVPPELAAEGIPVRLTCAVLRFRPQAFYKWQANPVTEREWTDAHLANALVAPTTTNRSSAACCSPTSCTKPGTRSVNDGSGACARSRACSRSRRRRAAKAKPAVLDRRCTTASNVTSPRSDLRIAGLTGSMGRVASAGDNAAARGGTRPPRR
jgi:hypothetical protein